MVARQVYIISLKNLACEAFKGTLMTSAEQCIHVFQVNVRVATDLGWRAPTGGPCRTGACVCAPRTGMSFLFQWLYLPMRCLLYSVML